MAKQLDQPLRQEMIGALYSLELTQTFPGRSSLLAGIPKIPLNRSADNAMLDLIQIVDQFASLGRERKSGIRPLIVIADNALAFSGSWENETTATLKDVRRGLEDFYAGDMQPVPLPPPEPERLLFNQRDERVPVSFLHKALATARSVCRIQVPIIRDGVEAEKPSLGTGWIIAPGLIITNYHVIEARNTPNEPHATPADMERQAAGVALWFDYAEKEGSGHVEVKGFTLDACDLTLDYAFLRATQPDLLSGRIRLPLVRRQPTLARGYRLNIAQHSGGGPLSYAIRNNFYVGPGSSSAYLRYLTDTQAGSSGSPVLSDEWEVIGIHHTAQPIPAEYYTSLPQERYETLPEEIKRGERITYHNEGIAIHAILDHIPAAFRAEIVQAQGWTA